MLSGLVGTEIVLYGRNTLLMNGNWVSSKPLMQMPLMGSGHFLATRNALQRNRLHPAAWHGHQEVSANLVFAPGAVSLRYRMDSDAYVSALVNRDQDGSSGVRLSRHDAFPSRLFEVDRRGAVVSAMRLTAVPSDDRWHDLEMGFVDDVLHVRIDGLEVGSARLMAKREQFVSLRSGARPVEIDDVELWNAEGERVFRDGFRNTRGWVSVFARVMLLLGVGTLVLYAVLVVRGVDRRARSLCVATAALVPLVCGAIWLVFDIHVWSERYPYDNAFLPDERRPPALSTYVERARCRLVQMRGVFPLSWGRIRSLRPLPLIWTSVTRWTPGSREPDPNTGYWFDSRRPGELQLLGKPEPVPPPRQGTALRLAFLGTSQTFGSGAETVFDTFVGRVHLRLAGERSGDPVETFNLGVPGARSARLVDEYRRHWLRLEPDLMIVNLSFNDKNPDVLRRSLLELGELARAGDTSLIFVLEAAAPGLAPNTLELRHEAVSKAADTLGVPVWDLDGYMASPDVADSGFLWWDVIHLTSYGHECAADFIWRNLELSGHS